MAKEEGRSSGSPTDKKSALARSSSRVPYHMAMIPRPQEEYNIRANNLNEPFQHVWLQTSDDGSRVIHPLERFSLFDCANTNTGSVDPIKPLPMECTAFKLVETVKDLKDLVSKLHDVNEFAVDLEHNKYRSFQGLTCLMQISTRTEDFVVDTLKLRIHIGPYLREFFKDPSKKKVMHGADCDVLWLQRDFSIYVCNLFDTGQASRVLQLERNSLEYLLSCFCAVTVNKEYQSADWRQRPLPDEMLKYAREDTHYLLYIYDIMRGRLISASRNSKDGNDLLLEVYKRSYDVCLQLYEKELFTDTSYLHIYGLQSTDFNAQQLSVVAGLCEWRDKIARLADESTGYILPNKALLEIAKQMPLTASKLRKLVKSKHPYVELNLISVLGIIKDSVKMAAAFEITAQELQRAQLETVTAQETVVSNELEAFRISEVPTHMSKMPSVLPMKSERENVNRANGPENRHLPTSIHIKEERLQLGGCIFGCSRVSQGSYFELSGDSGVVKKELVGHPQDIFKESSSVSRQIRDTNIKMADLRPEKSFAGSTVQVPNKPSPNFGAFFKNSSTHRKFNADPKDKVDQIKSIILPFDLLNGRNKHLKPFAVHGSQEIEHPREHVSVQAGMTKLKDVSLGYKPFHMNISQGIQQRNHQPFYDFPRATSACLANRGSPGTSALENVNDVSVSQELESDLHPKTIPFPEVREEMIYGEHQDEDARIECDGGHKDLLTSRERCRNSEISKVLRDKETEFAAG